MFQFLNLDNASKAEKEILHTILFKDGHHQRKEFFKDLRPEYETALDGDLENEVQDAIYGGPGQQTRPHHHHQDVDRSDTSSTADITIENDSGMPNDISTNSMRSQGEQQMRTYFTSAPVPQNPHPGGPHPLGHHPQMPMYHHPQMMQNPPPGQYLPPLPSYPVIPVAYGGPAPHNIGLPHHPQAYMPADVSDIHMHQKLHDMHHSPGGGAPHTSKYRNPKNSRPRRGEETYHTQHPQYYSNMGYPPPMYYTTQAVTNMTGTPLIMPGSGAPAPMYHQTHYPPQMYPPMIGTDQHIHHQQQQHGGPSPNISQRSERMDSPRNDNSLSFSGANGDSISTGLSSTLIEQPQRAENEDTGNTGMSSNSNNSQPPIVTTGGLKMGIENEEVRTIASPQKSSDRPEQLSQPPVESETPVPVAPVTATAPVVVPDNKCSETLNGNLTDSSPQSARSEQQNEKEQLPETKLVEEIANVPSKQEQQPRTWSSTVNGGISPTPPAAVQNVTPASAPATSAAAARRVEKEKDSAEFPHLNKTTASGPTPTTTSAAAPSTSQSKGMSWASVASRNGPPNGTASTISHEAKKSTGESLGYYESSGGTRKDVAENDSSVGLYSGTSISAHEPVYDNDPVALRLGEYLSTYVLDHHTFSLTPRGLSNQNNFCYINATLQALVACPPFVNLFRSLYDIIGKKPCKSTPIIQSMYEFIMEFEPITRLSQQRNRKTNDAFYVGANFEASGIRKVLGLLDGATFKVEGRQQDAEEFLSHLLNALHDEMIKVIKWNESKKEKSAQSKSGHSSKEAMAQPQHAATDEDDDSEQWQVMGPKNKGCMTRKTSLSKSPISEMFVGQMCSALNRANSLKSTTLQPFFTLQLDIQSENIHSIRDALDGISVKEEVTGCVASNGLETEAWKQMSLEVLPAILILHMKRFVFDTTVNTIRKLDKRVDFSIDLEIAKDLLSINSRNKYSLKQRQYKLFAVVYHDGEEAIKGHYIADTFHPSGGSLWGQFGWIRYDDTAVKGVGETQILNPQSPRVPYLLYYRRVDTLQTKKDRS